MTVKVQCPSLLLGSLLCSNTLVFTGAWLFHHTPWNGAGQSQEWFFPGHCTLNYKLKSVAHPDVAQAALTLVKLRPASRVMRADGSPAGLCLLVTCLRSAQASSASFKLCVVSATFCCRRAGGLQDLHCIFGFSIGTFEAEKEVKPTTITHYVSNLFCSSPLFHACI